MIRGIDSFREWFEGYENQYVIIGGTACDLIMSNEGLDFRATKDIDMVLIIEMINYEFGKKLWKYITSAGYEHKNKSDGMPQFYRFTNPKSKEFPFMIELFSRRPNMLFLPKEAILTPFPIDEGISSLSAILLNEDYYAFLKNGRIQIDGVTIIDAPYLIPFKAKAWLDLSTRKARGEKVDSKNIRKHKNDVFRLTELLNRDMQMSGQMSDAVHKDMSYFIEQMKHEEIDLKQLKIRGKTKEEILSDLAKIYL